MVPCKRLQINIFSAWRCRSISDSLTGETIDNIADTDFMHDKINFASFPLLSSDNSVTILLNDSALTKSSKVSLQGLFLKTFITSVNPWSTFSNPPKC